MTNSALYIENYSFTRFISNMKKLLNNNNNRSIYKNLAIEDLELSSEANNFSKAINPNILRILSQKIASKNYQYAYNVGINLLTRSSVLKNV